MSEETPKDTGYKYTKPNSDLSSTARPLNGEELLAEGLMNQGDPLSEENFCNISTIMEMEGSAQLEQPLEGNQGTSTATTTALEEQQEPQARLERASTPTPEEEIRDELVYLYGCDQILSPTGELVDVSVLKNKYVAVFISSLNTKEEFGKNGAEMNALVADFAEVNMDRVAVLYLSQDHTKEDFNTFLENKPFYAIPFEQVATRQTMTEEFDISSVSLPAIVIMSPGCEILTTWGKSAILWNSENCVSEWELQRPGITYAQLFGSKYLNLF
mmetsp:Transcript_13972/g.16232  ORF Transcript_13972/g.16232 Transcript_13972/m.16232 type:complete len:272 (+) Transcript_13972:530-1345(+)